MKDDAMKEEFLKALEDTDLMFCGNPSPKPKGTFLFLFDLQKVYVCMSHFLKFCISWRFSSDFKFDFQSCLNVAFLKIGVVCHSARNCLIVINPILIAIYVAVPIVKVLGTYHSLCTILPKGKLVRRWCC